MAGWEIALLILAGLAALIVVGWGVTTLVAWRFVRKQMKKMDEGWK